MFVSHDKPSLVKLSLWTELIFYFAMILYYKVTTTTTWIRGHIGLKCHSLLFSVSCEQALESCTWSWFSSSVDGNTKAITNSTIGSCSSIYSSNNTYKRKYNGGTFYNFPYVWKIRHQCLWRLMVPPDFSNPLF